MANRTRLRGAVSTFCPEWASRVERRSDGYTRYEVDQLVTVTVFAGWKANARLVAADGRWLMNPIVRYEQRYEDDDDFPSYHDVRLVPRVQTVRLEGKGRTEISFRGVLASTKFGPPSRRGVQRLTINATGFKVQTMPGEPLSAEQIALRVIGGQT